MRHTATYLQILFALLLASCGNSAEMRRLLEHTDSLNQAYAPLDTVTYMERVADYYDTFGSREDRIRAFYLLGSVYRDKQDAPRALEWFDKAAGACSSPRTDKEHLELSKVYIQQALLYDEMQYTYKSHDAWETAARYALQGKDSLLHFQCIGGLGECYWMSGDLKKSMACVRVAHDGFLKLGREEYAASSQAIPIAYYLRCDSIRKAETALREYRALSGMVHEDGTVEKGAEIHYFYLGQFYEKTGRLDSAEFCFRKLLTYSDDIQNVENGNRGLMTVFQKCHQVDSVVKYSTLYAMANDTANVRHSAQELIRVQSLYNYSESQRRMIEAESLTHKLQWGIAFFAVVLLCFSLYVRQRILKHRVQARKKQSKYMEKSRQLGKAQKEIATLKENYKRLLELKELEVEMLSGEIDSLTGSLNGEKLFEENYPLDVVVRRLKTKANAGKPMTGKEWMNVENCVRTEHGKFFEALNIYKDILSEQEYVVCVLTYLHFAPGEAGILLDMSPQSLSNARTRINAKLFKQKGAKTLLVNLLRLEV